MNDFLFVSVQLSFDGLSIEALNQVRTFRPGDGGEDYDKEVEEAFEETAMAGYTVEGGRRRRRGELLRAPDGSIVTKHDSQLNGLANAAELTAEYEGAGDLEEVSWQLGRINTTRVT